VVERGHTGRRIEVGYDFYRAQKLARRPFFLLRFSPWVWRIARHLRDSPVAAPSILVLVRARPNDNSIHGWEQMGPPPLGRGPAGRYNRAGTSVLYLSTSEEGVRLELPNRRLCLQQYEIDLSRLRIADFRSTQTPDVLRAAFDLAESACVPGRNGPSNYAFSQFLASLISRLGFDGFIVPGVRGGPTTRYENVVMLHPEGSWVSWSAGASGFRRDPNTS
jgi:RES domain-containing protein